MVVKATLFNNDHKDDLINLLERVMTPEYLLFGTTDYLFVSNIKKD